MNFYVYFLDKVWQSFKTIYIIQKEKTTFNWEFVVSAVKHVHVY